MPYVNWSKADIRPEFEERSARLTLGLRAEQVALLGSELASLFPGADQQISHRELRLDLPAGWTLFWKRREGESRYLLAHPEQQTWVATLALEGEEGARLVSALSSGAFDGPFELGTGAPSSAPTSNFNLRIEIR